MGLALDEPNENEQPLRINGIDVLIEESARLWVDEATVDYVKDDYSEGFVIKGSSSC